MTVRRSVQIISDVLGAEELLSTYSEIDTLGYDTIWTSETIGRDIVTSMTALALSTSKSSIGASIIPIMHRHPFEVAMAATSIDAFSGGRLRLGLGVSHPPFVRSYGLEIERPLRYVREFVTVLRALLRGEEVEFEGEMLSAHGKPHPLRDYDRGDSIRIYMAALQPNMLRLAGEIADGVYMFLVTPEYIEKARGYVAEGAELAGRDPKDIENFEFIQAVPAVFDTDLDSAREYARYTIDKYVRMPFYRNILRVAGIGTDADFDMVSDRIIDTFCVFGSPENFDAHERALGDAGVTEVSHFPIFTRPDDYMQSLIASAPRR